MTQNPADAWREVATTKDAAAIGALLAEDCVFHSPVVHTPQRGKQITLTYLLGASAVLGNEHFRYVAEWTGPRSAVLEFVTEIDGIIVNGVDIITTDEAGLITDFTVMIRPLKAINLVHQKMGELLAALAKRE